MKKKNEVIANSFVLRPGERPWDYDELRGQVRWERAGLRMKHAIEWILPMARWDTVIMGSHRESVSVASMKNLVYRFHSRYMKGCPLVFGIELHPGGHGAHWHGCAQLGHRAPSESERVLLRSRLWEAWFDQHGRCSFWPPRSSQDVIGYALKDSLGEAIKDGDWGLLGFKPGCTGKLGRAEQRTALRFRQGLVANPDDGNVSPSWSALPACSPADSFDVDLRASARIFAEHIHQHQRGEASSKARWFYE